MLTRRTRTLAWTLLALTGCSVSAAADVVYGPMTLKIDLARSWNAPDGGLLAADSATSGPVQYGTGLWSSPTQVLSTPLTAPSQQTWPSHAESRANLSQSGNTQFMRSFVSGVLIALASPPSTGQGHLDVTLEHHVDFQITQPTAWSAVLRTVLTSPVYPTFQLIADPLGSATVITTHTLPTTEPDMMDEIGGMLAPGSYRALTRMVLNHDFPSAIPMFTGGIHSASVEFIVPTPATGFIAAAIAGAFIRGRRRTTSPPSQLARS